MITLELISVRCWSVFKDGEHIGRIHREGPGSYTAVSDDHQIYAKTDSLETAKAALS